MGWIHAGDGGVEMGARQSRRQGRPQREGPVRQVKQEGKETRGTRNDGVLGAGSQSPSCRAVERSSVASGPRPKGPSCCCRRAA